MNRGRTEWARCQKRYFTETQTVLLGMFPYRRRYFQGTKKDTFSKEFQLILLFVDKGDPRNIFHLRGEIYENSKLYRCRVEETPRC